MSKALYAATVVVKRFYRMYAEADNMQEATDKIFKAAHNDDELKQCLDPEMDIEDQDIVLVTLDPIDGNYTECKEEE